MKITDVLEDLIKERKTLKVLCEPNEHVPVPLEIDSKNRKIVQNCLRTSGWAPFHFKRNVDSIAEPWRAHIIWNNKTKEIATYLKEELKLTSKEPLLTAACSALVLVTWLPEDLNAGREENIQLRNEEHLAAASAMVQNFLLLLTSHRMGTYWSSGGVYKKREVLDSLGVGSGEKLLAAVFIEYPEMMHLERLRKPGAHRDSRSEHWIREIA